MQFSYRICTLAILFLTNIPVHSQNKKDCPTEVENSKSTPSYFHSKEVLLEDPFQFSCLRIFFLSEPSLESLKSSLTHIEQHLSSQENFELHVIALEKAMTARNIELGLVWGRKIYQSWKDKEDSHKSIYTYAYFLFSSEDYTTAKEVLNWLQSRTNKKSLLKKIGHLSKKLEVP